MIGLVFLGGEVESDGEGRVVGGDAESAFFDKDDVYFLTADKWYLYKEGTNIDMHQYWPIFDVNVAASNGTLWNDYEY